MILVTAANGNQGKLLVPKLVAAGLPVRACVRSAESGQFLQKSGVADVVVGDITEPDILARALRDVALVYHVGPTAHPKERQMGIAMVDAAKAAGVKHFVLSSVLHAIITELVQHEIKRDVEEHLLCSGLEYTILQPSNFMSPLKLRPVFEKGVFRLSWSLSRYQSVVDLDDITDVAVAVLKDPAHHAGATYELVGPGRYTAHDLAGIISAVLQKPIAVEEIDADRYLKEFFGDVGPEQFPHEARVLRALSAHYSSHDFIGNSNVLAWLLGRKPTTYEQFVRRQYEIYQQTKSMSFSTAR